MLRRALSRFPASRLTSTTTTTTISSSNSTPSSRRESRRGRFVVKRRWWLPHIPNLEDVSKYPYDENERGDFHVYDLVEETHNKPASDMTLVMTTYVEGFGDIGDIVQVSRDDARNYLLPARLAEYPSQENLDRIRAHCRRLNMTDRVQRTPFAGVTARELSESLNLPIVMHPTNPWTLNKGHVLTALRKVGVVVEGPDCVELPPEPVTSPGEIVFKLTINKLDVVDVKATILFWRVDLDGNIVHEPIEVWRKPKEKPKDWLVQSAEPVTRI